MENDRIWDTHVIKISLYHVVKFDWNRIVFDFFEFTIGASDQEFSGGSTIRAEFMRNILNLWFLFSNDLCITPEGVYHPFFDHCRTERPNQLHLVF